MNAAAQTSRVDSGVDMQEFIRDWQISKQLRFGRGECHARRGLSLQTSAEEMTFGERMLHIASSNVHRFHEIAPEFRRRLQLI